MYPHTSCKQGNTQGTLADHCYTQTQKLQLLASKETMIDKHGLNLTSEFWLVSFIKPGFGHAYIVDVCNTLKKEKEKRAGKTQEGQNSVYKMLCVLNQGAHQML